MITFAGLNQDLQDYGSSFAWQLAESRIYADYTDDADFKHF